MRVSVSRFSTPEFFLIHPESVQKFQQMIRNECASINLEAFDNARQAIVTVKLTKAEIFSIICRVSPREMTMQLHFDI